MHSLATHTVIQALFLSDKSSIRRAVEIIEAAKTKMALVVDDEQRLLGAVTDGDVRRALLRGTGLDDSVDLAMNRRPITARRNDGLEHLYDLMLRNNLQQIPVLDERERVVDLVQFKDLLSPAPLDNWVVVMAGGEGKRLRPLTETTPKPMLPVGGRPILETIIERFHLQGLTNFILSVNYQADIIKNHFGNGDDHKVRIRYVEEKEPLGTAGSLRLLPETPTLPFVIINGDVLTTLDFRDALAFHQETEALITVCVQKYQTSIPFGVVTVANDQILDIEEKPIYEYFINSGIYIMDPAGLALLPPEGKADMPQLVALALKHGARVSAFPIREYWKDVGRIEDLHRAQEDFMKVFRG